MNKPYSILILLFILCLSCKNEAPVQEDVPSESDEIILHPVEEDYEESRIKWGYINKNGQLVIGANYDDCRNFSEGLAVVRIKGRWGFINKEGDIVIPVQYKGAYDFKEGLARVQTFEEVMGFVDPTGKMAIPAKFEEVQDFSEGLARIRENE